MSRSKITPHPSHKMGIEDGEECCVRCYAAPWMPVVEQECNSLVDRRGVDTRIAGHMTLADAEYAAARKADGARWQDIADDLGRSRLAVQQAVLRMERGEGRLAREKRKRDQPLDTSPTEKRT